MYLAQTRLEPSTILLALPLSSPSLPVRVMGHYLPLRAMVVVEL
jgi:hypothetical protein